MFVLLNDALPHYVRTIGNWEAGMRIAQIAPLYEAVPPKLYGGTERVVSFLTEELVAMGHDVTLFASGDSVTRAKLEAAWPRALRLDPGIRDTVGPHMVLMEQVRQRVQDFDVLHFHIDYWPASLFARQPVPVVTTLHGRLDLPEFRAVYAGLPPMHLVAISEGQRASLPQGNFIGTVPHGLPEHLLMPMAVEPGYVAFLGRICAEKGPDKAIRIARAAGIPLQLAAKVDRADVAYFESVVRPMLGPDAALIGEIDERTKPDFLSGAKALLMPIDWPEPFGLVMIEALACGTPVIAFNRGSVPEIIEDGVTGFIVENEAEAVAALARVEQLDRAVIRAAFERRFSARRMAADYLAVYESLVTTQGERLRLVG